MIVGLLAGGAVLLGTLVVAVPGDPLVRGEVRQVVQRMRGIGSRSWRADEAVAADEWDVELPDAADKGARD